MEFDGNEYHTDTSHHDADLAALHEQLDRYSAELRRTQQLLGFEEEESRFSFDDDSGARGFSSPIANIGIDEEEDIFEQFSDPVASIEVDEEEEAEDIFEEFSAPFVRPSRSASLPKKDPVSLNDEIQQYDEEIFQRAEGRPLKSRRLDRPLPIVVPPRDTPPQEVQSAQLPMRTSSRTVAQRSVSDDGSEAKSHRRHVTISEGPQAARKTLLLSTPMGFFMEDVPPIPGLSPSDSTTTARWSPLPTPPLMPNIANEDKVRREMELFTLRDGATQLVGNKYRKMHPPALQLDSDDEDGEKISQPESSLKRPVKKPIDDDQRSVMSTKSEVKRRKSIFARFQRQNELDKLIDMYLDEVVPDEKPEIKRKASLARRMTRSFRKQVDVPPLPPPRPPPPPMPVQLMDNMI